MKNYVFYFLLLAFFISCNSDDDTEPQVISPCIKALYEPGPAQDTNLLSIKKMEVNGEDHFWLENGNQAFDGTEYIVNESCDTVCLFCGFCPPPPCNSDYENGDWEIVWEK